MRVYPKDAETYGHPYDFYDFRGPPFHKYNCTMCNKESYCITNRISQYCPDCFVDHFPLEAIEII